MKLPLGIGIHNLSSIVSIRDKFYYYGFDITLEWFSFFSGLEPDKEIDCQKLFIKKYKAKYKVKYQNR